MYENYEYSSCGTSHAAYEKYRNQNIKQEFGARQLHYSQGGGNWNTVIASLKYFVYQTKSFLNFGKERDEKINTYRLHGKVERGILKQATDLKILYS